MPFTDEELAKIIEEEEKAKEEANWEEKEGEDERP